MSFQYRAFRLIKIVANVFAGSGIGKIPGLVRLYESLHELARPRRGIVPVRCHGKTLFVDAADTGFIPYLICDGVYEPYETELFQQLIQPGMVVVDVGANVGYYTLLAADRVGPTGRVYAFEPDPDNYALLVRNVAHNRCTNVVTVPRALDSGSGVRALFLGSHNLGRHSFASDNVPDVGGRVDVNTIGLDEFFATMADQGDGSRVGLIKIDVEGAEGLVLAGARETLVRNDTAVLLEFWPTGMRRLGSDPRALLDGLTAIGFDLRQIDERKARCTDGIVVDDLIATCEAPGQIWPIVNLLLSRSAYPRRKAPAAPSAVARAAGM